MKRGRTPAVLLLGLLTLAALVYFTRQPTLSQPAGPGGRETQLVYKAWAETGEKHSEVIYPQSVDTLYLLADSDNALIPILTEVYYWAPTLDYRADFAALDRRYDGVLEISRSGEVIAEVGLEPFAVVYDKVSPKELVFGPQAEQSFATFQEESAEVAGELDAYYQASAEYQLAYEKYLDEIKAGNLNAARPEPPEAGPPVVDRYVSGPEPAFRINLPPGDYELRLLTAGKTQFVETSQKKLHVFAPRRQGTGYKVFVAERWRQPAIAADPNAPVYVRRGSQVYLEPYRAQEFNRYDYSKLLNPQQPAAGRDTWEWVLSDPIQEARMVFQSGRDASWTIDYQPFTVEQTSDTAFGYAILPFEAAGEESRPDFSAFQLPAAGDFDSGQFFLAGPDGNPLPGSQRRIVAPPGRASEPLYFLAAAPLLLGAVFIGYRKRRTTRRRKLEES